MANDYTGTVERWKVDLARSRIRDFGIVETEEGDLLQDLVLKIRRFRFDPAKANGGGGGTALRRIIDNYLVDHIRSKERRKGRTRRYGRLVTRRDDHEDDTPLRLDVRLAIEQLPDLDRAVCEGLARGKPKTHIARDLGFHPKVVYRAVRRVRQRFQRIGLGRWLGE